MFKHPTVIASIILSGGMLISAVLICFALHSVETAIHDKFIPGAVPPADFPNPLRISGPYGGAISVQLGTPNGSPVSVKQVP